MRFRGFACGIWNAGWPRGRLWVRNKSRVIKAPDKVVSLLISYDQSHPEYHLSFFLHVNLEHSQVFTVGCGQYGCKVKDGTSA